jgi:hemerythrin-like domain-containing protein
MKRDPRLQPLSREHHHGLMAIVLVRRLLDSNPSAGRVRVVAQQFVDFHHAALVPHFRHEEDWLLPLLEQGGEVEALRERTLRDHAGLHRLAGELDRAVEQDGDLDAALRRLCDRLEDHIHFEEHELLVAAEQYLSAEDLDRLGRDLAETEATDVLIPGSD